MGKAPSDELTDLDALETEVSALRERTQSLLTELEARMQVGVDRARHTIESAKTQIVRVRHAVDLREQLRRRPGVVASVGAATLALVGLGVWWVTSRRARRRQLAPRVARKLSALGELLAHPDRALYRSPGLGRKLSTAVLVSAAAAIARALSADLMRSLLAPRPPHPPRGLLQPHAGPRARA